MSLEEMNSQMLEEEELLTDSTELEEEHPGGRFRRVSKLLFGASLLAVVLFCLHRRSTWDVVHRRIRPVTQGSQFWVPSGWHKDAQGRDVKDTWDHYQMPNCDSGPPPGAKKKVIVGPHNLLRKMQEKMKLDPKKVKVHPAREMKDVLDLTNPEPAFFTSDSASASRRLRGDLVDPFFLDQHPDRVLKDLEGMRGLDTADGKVHVKLVPLTRTPAQQICAEHVAIASSDHARMIEAHKSFEEHRKRIRGLHYWQGTHRCTEQLYNTDFISKAEWRDNRGVKSPAHCQRACTWNTACEGFSWSKWGCFLKKHPKVVKQDSKQIRRFQSKFTAGVYSGYPCQYKESPYPWINDELQKHSLPKPKEFQPAKNASMFCSMLILPYSYEVDLTVMQHKNYYSIFACELWKIYSSQRLQLAPGLKTHLINTSQVAEAAGQWGTALNTGAFVAYWRALVQDGDYLKARWLVKVDPDTVWFPQRLIPILVEQEQTKSLEAPGIYLNNCKTGLHGPIEVVSQTAFSTLAEVSSKCFWAMNDWGNWQWGEDMWFDQCMLTVGHAHRTYVQKLLAEDHCTNWPGWRSCAAKDIVAFHPFKQADAYVACTETEMTSSTTQTLTFTSSVTTVTTTQTTTRMPNLMEGMGNFFTNIFHH